MDLKAQIFEYYIDILAKMIKYLPLSLTCEIVELSYSLPFRSDLFEHFNIA